MVPTICVTLAVVALAEPPDVALPLWLTLPLALPVALACTLPSLSTPLVTVTGSVATSVPSYVVVLLPGKFASEPPADSVHVTVAPRLQSAVAVAAWASPTPISRWYVDGPYTSVMYGKRPQSFESVPEGHARAMVVADGFADTTDATIAWVSKP